MDTGCRRGLVTTVALPNGVRLISARRPTIDSTRAGAPEPQQHSVQCSPAKSKTRVLWHPRCRALRNEQMSRAHFAERDSAGAIALVFWTLPANIAQNAAVVRGRRLELNRSWVYER